MVSGGRQKIEHQILQYTLLSPTMPHIMNWAEVTGLLPLKAYW